MTEENPARLASKRSIDCSQRKAKDEWLALFADDATVQDPVGPSMLDPEGKGHSGKEAISAFWDNNIASTPLKFEITDSFAGGLEVANVGTIHLTFPNDGTARCEGVFAYRVNEEGKIVSLKAHWEFDRMMATATPPPEG